MGDTWANVGYTVGAYGLRKTRNAGKAVGRAALHAAKATSHFALKKTASAVKRLKPVVDIPPPPTMGNRAMQGARLAVWAASKYFTPGRLLVMGAQALLHHGLRRAEAIRLATLVTPARRRRGNNNNKGGKGYLVVRHGSFPFPMGLYEFVTGRREFDQTVKDLMTSMTKEDRATFKHEFIPLAQRDLPRRDREGAHNILRKFIAGKYDPSSVGIVMKRLAYADICHATMVRAAIEFKGSDRSKKWIEKYAELRGIRKSNL